MPGFTGIEDYTVANGMGQQGILDELEMQGVIDAPKKKRIISALAGSDDFYGLLEKVVGGDSSTYLRTYTLLAQSARMAKKPLVAGSVSVVLDQDGEITGTLNRAHHFNATGVEIASYDKVHLVPFGEFIPFSKSIPPVGRLIAAMMPVETDCLAGEDFVVFEEGGWKYGPAICFEDTFSYIGREYRRRGADILLNITNDGWFGGSFELEVHLGNAVMRAVETRMAVVRAANTGVSAVISPTGRIVSRLTDDAGNDREIKGSLVSAVPVSSARTLYCRVGDTWLLALFLGIICLASKRSRKGRGKGR